MRVLADSPSAQPDAKSQQHGSAASASTSLLLCFVLAVFPCTQNSDQTLVYVPHGNTGLPQPDGPLKSDRQREADRGPSRAEAADTGAEG